MCGICGVYGAAPLELAALRAMTDTIVHRGPDEDGYFVEGGVGLGMRRLSIIDVAGGQQPIGNEDGSVQVVFNGEIYNYADLRQRLLARGHTLATASDTESIVHLYEDYGVECVRELWGMFAFALYDRARRRLLLARDRLGKKPLYYAHVGGRLLFGSEIKTLLRAAPELRRVRRRAVQPFFRFGFVPEPETIYEDIYSLPAGCTLVYEGGELVVRPYWELSFAAAHANGNGHRSPADYADELDALLADAVRVRLMSEVPLGAFLSGGTDSSLVVAYMSRQLERPVKTFTIAYDEAAYDESADAKRVADHCGSEHHVRTLRVAELRDSFFTTIDAITRHSDQPFGDSSALPTFHVSKLAREEVTVILAGDGADEVFGGYTMYRGLRFAERYQQIPPWVRQRMIAPALAGWAASRPAGAARWRANAWHKRIADSDLPLRAMLASKFSMAVQPLIDDLVPGAHEALAADERSGARWIECGDSPDPFEQALYADTRFHLVNDMLVKVDRMSMAHSLEVRCPYLDHRVVEFAASIPPDLKLRGFETKAILRDVAARHVPAANARKKKQGFEVPISRWLRESLWPEAVERLEASQGVREYLSPTVVRAALEEHRAGQRNHGQLIWCLLVFDAWHRQYLEA